MAIEENAGIYAKHWLGVRRVIIDNNKYVMDIMFDVVGYECIVLNHEVELTKKARVSACI